jgi:hypothetical protein
VAHHVDRPREFPVERADGPSVVPPVLPVPPAGEDLREKWLAKGAAADRRLDRRLKFTVTAAIAVLILWAAAMAL